MSEHVGPDFWEQIAREVAGPDDQPCSDWAPDAGGAHCSNCGWGHGIHHRDHAAREMGDAFGGLIDETTARILYSDEGDPQ